MAELKYPQIQEFIKELEENDRKYVNICLHHSPDPDAMGSAIGLQVFLKYNGIMSDIYYSGEISHPQNKTIVNVLDISLKKCDSIQKDAPNVCVDCTENNSCVEEAMLVVDHHRNETKAKYSVVQPTFGACASIVWQIMKENEFSLDKRDTDDVKIATALLLGIRTDTNDLISETMTKEDFSSYQELLEISDKESLQKVMNYPLPRYLYDRRIKLHKDGNYSEANGMFVGGIGYITANQRDSIAILSEEYARMESINTAVIFAIVGDKDLQVSVRSSLTSLDVGTMCKDLFGDFGGGKAYKGGASIPLNFYSSLEEDKDKFWELTCKHMFTKVLKEATLESEKGNK